MNGLYRVLWLVLTGPATSPAPVLVPRAPLPPFDPDTTDPDTHAPLPVYTVLREDPPPHADVRWWRGDAWGITIPGLPLVPGGATSGGARNRVLTYFLDRYDRHTGGPPHIWEDVILEQHRANGYTHISLSPQDSAADGMTMRDYVAMSKRCAAAGLFVHHLLRSKYYTDLEHPNLDDVNTLVEELLRQGAAHIFTPAWECTAWDPDIVRAMIDHDAALIGERARIMLHMYPHYIAWPPNHEDSATFWRKNYGKVDGLLYQCDPTWAAGMMAARIQDGLDRLAPGGMYGLGLSGRMGPDGQEHPIWYTVWETVATCMYNNATDGDGRVSDEDTANLKGYECLCAPGAMTVCGFGNGGRRPDGTAL